MLQFSLCDLLLLQALGDYVVGYTFIFAPHELFPGLQEAVDCDIFCQHAFECFGFTFFLWSTMVALKRHDPTFQLANIAYNVTWSSYCGLFFLTNGKGWRGVTAVSDGAWGAPPATVHFVFTILSLVTYIRSRKADTAAAASMTKDKLHA